MELVLVGSGPWKRVVQPWSWGNGTTDSLFFLGTHKKKLCINILWHIQIWVAEKLLTSLEETGNEASKRSKEKNNSTEHDMYDFAWHSSKSQSFRLCQMHSRQEPQFSDVAAVPGSWSWSLWQLNHHLYKDLYSCVFQGLGISGFLVFFVCFSPGSGLWNTDFNQIFGGLARLAWSWATCSAHCCKQTRTADLICEWPWWIMRQGSIICARDRMTWLEVGQRHPWH